MSEKEFLEQFIKNNPFNFKQGIINQCRKLDKLDVYEWVAEDELKIQKLQQENQQLKQKYENAVADYESEKSKNQRAINNIDLVIELIKQQPTEDDSWILGRLNGFKIILKGENNE